MPRLPLELRRAVTTALIRLGPANKLVLALLNRKCRQFGVSLTNRGDALSLRKDRREMLLATKHFVYAPDMAERFDLYFDALVPMESDGILVLDYSRPGILQTYARSGLQFRLASFPEEDEAIDSYFRYYTPAAGDIVFDVGAHCGVSTHRFAKLVGPAGRVISFEPDPVNFSLLVSNIELHHLDNVLPLQIAVAGTSGTAAFSCEESIGSGLMRQASRASVGKVVMVETITLEEAFRKWGPPIFCKIDIEGSEIEVISASRDFLKSLRACEFVLDTHHLVDGRFTDTRIEALFRECGYETSSSVSGFKTTWARPLPNC
jgi:FkbM family methyltransferase